MKRLRYVMLIVGFIFVSGTFAQNKEINSKHQQIMAMMQDSTLMDMIMAHIAEDDHMRMKMMHKIMDACNSDTSKMMGMCKMMMGDEEMRSSMMEMMHKRRIQQPDHQQHHPMQGNTQSMEQEVLVKFKPDADVEKITAMADNIGLQQVKEIKALNLRVFKITSNKSVEEVIQKCKKETFVDYAEPNQTYKTQE